MRAFVQARMSSARFPGKVLAPFRGRPMIRQVVDRVAEAVGTDGVVVATSREASDDPLAAYLAAEGVPVHRGALDDVVGRFQSCLEAHPCDWFVRICADSPLLDPAVVRLVTAHADRADLDLVTNVFPRTFPHGHSVEMVRGARFAALDRGTLTAHQREHVTRVFYDRPGDYRILNVESGDPARAQSIFTVDTLEDLRRLEPVS